MHTEDQLPQIIADFLVEHSEVQPLDHRIVKKFTSLAKNPIPSAHIYDPTLFRWDFGDGTPIIETSSRTIYHIYEHPGKYIVRHQACNSCICSNWDLCFKKVTVRHESDHDTEEDEDEE